MLTGGLCAIYHWFKHEREQMILFDKHRMKEREKDEETKGDEDENNKKKKKQRKRRRHRKVNVEE